MRNFLLSFCMMLRMNICNVLSHNTGFNCGTVTLGVGQLISSVYWYDSQV